MAGSEPRGLTTLPSLRPSWSNRARVPRRRLSIGPRGLGPAILAFALALSACAGEEDLTLADDEVALVVVVDAEDHLVASQWVRPGEAHRLALSAPHALVILRLPREGVVYLGEGSWLDQLPSVHTVDTLPCAVCLAPPTTSEQQRVAPGEACPVPSGASGVLRDPDGATAEAAALRLARVRASLRLAWGPPACARVARMGPSNGSLGSTFDTMLPAGGLPWTRLHGVRSPPPPALVAEDLSAVDVLIVESIVRTYTSTEARVLEAWVRAGGGLMVTSGFGNSTEPARINSLLSALDITVSGPPRDALLVAFEQHRVTRGVVELDFMGGFGVRGGGLPFARTAEGPVALVREHGAGRVVVWGDDWILGNPTLDRSPDGKLFWANSLLWLAGAP